jgi:hypothetical protein
MDLGFGGLLQMPETCQRRQMIIEIVKRFEPNNQSFRICDQDIQIQLEDVKDIMGLPIEGKNVFSHKGPKGNKTECNKEQQDLFLRFAKGKNQMSINGLKEIIINSGSPDDDFKSAFVLFTIGVILAPTTKDYVHSSYLPVVMEISEIPKFNWGEFTLKFLTNSCHQYKLLDSGTIQGNLTLLQVSSIYYSRHK